MKNAKSIYIEEDNSITIIDDTDFDIQHILACGQIFRYKKLDNAYIIYARDQKIEVYCQKGGFKIFAQNLNFVKKYFDLYNNYANIKSDLRKKNLTDAVISYGHGIRILNQDPFEMIISFIISANNNIPRIKGIIERLCDKVGTNMGEFRAFPTVEQMSKLTEDDYKNLGCGYRSNYLFNTVRQIKDGFDLDNIAKLDTDEARAELMKLKGVGRKVADCILLFGYHKTDVFPTDTWIVKAYKDEYGEEKSAEFVSNYYKKLFDVNSGYAQQYMYYEKMNNRGDKK